MPSSPRTLIGVAAARFLPPPPPLLLLLPLL
jgi:hypothetical protein